MALEQAPHTPSRLAESADPTFRADGKLAAEVETTCGGFASGCAPRPPPGEGKEENGEHEGRAGEDARAVASATTPTRKERSVPRAAAISETVRTAPHASLECRCLQTVAGSAFSARSDSLGPAFMSEWRRASS